MDNTGVKYCLKTMFVDLKAFVLILKLIFGQLDSSTI